MKIRTVEQLYDFMSDELAWRRKELAALRQLIGIQSFSLNKKNVLLRSTVTLIYAHWEGFIKACANAYLQFVAMQRLKHDELAVNFIALSMRPMLMGAFQSKKSKDHIEVVRFFLDDMPSRSSIPYKNVVSTQNLSSTVLQNIVEMLGLDYSAYKAKEKLIEQLRNSRNSIAHGEDTILGHDDVLELHRQVLDMMSLFLNQIDNSASLKLYRNL